MNDDEPDYAVQRLNMLFEHRRPKKASVSTTIFATRMVSRHIKRNQDPASPSYISHAARRRDHLYRREDAPFAPRRSRRRRCLPAAEAAGSLFFFFFDDLNVTNNMLLRFVPLQLSSFNFLQGTASALKKVARCVVCSPNWDGYLAASESATEYKAASASVGVTHI